jgi:glycosyltransferase involved in cell wall biosynthesis
MGLKVAMVSPWGKTTRCGIRTYTEHLVAALTQLDVDVFVCRWPRFGQRTPELIESCVLDKIPRNVDLIHLQHEYGLFTPNLEGGVYAYLKRLGKPVVTTMHAVGSYAVDKIVGDVSDKIVLHNEFCTRYFQGNPRKVVIIPHGATPSKCIPTEEAKRSLGIDPRIPIIGVFGFLSQVKGFELALEALERLPNAAMLVTGGWFTTAETEYLELMRRNALARFPGRIRFLGFVPDEQLPTVFGAQDVVLFCHRYATESGALLTALSYGKCCLTSRLPPFREKEKLGVLQTYRDVPDMVRKLKRLLADEALRRKFEETAHNYAESVKWYPNIAQAHINIYNEILESHKV